MDQRERSQDVMEALRAALDGRQAGIWTALPGIVQSFDAVAQTCVVQPSIQARVSAKDGSVKFQNMPLLLDCPVHFPSGGGVTLTFPVKLGDECLVVLASRCIDAWWQQGGIQPPMEARMHDLSDGFAFVGFRSQPRKLTNVSTTAAQMRSDDGATLVALNPTAKTLVLTAPNGATINANTTINGTLHVTGAVTCDADVTASGTVTGQTDVVAAGISGKGHHHSGVTAGAANTGAPF